MDEENVNDFTQSAIPTTGAPSFSQSIMPGIYAGQEKTAQGMANMYQRREKEEKEKAEKLKKQKAIWNQQLLDMPDVFEQDYNEIKKKVDEYNDFIITKKSAGEDMDNLSDDDIKKMRELQNQIRRSALISKDNEEYWKQLQKDIDDDETGKYDKEHAAKWNAEYATLTPEGKMEYRNTKDPKKLNFGLLDFVDDTIPPNDKITDTGRVKITMKDPVEHKHIILETIRNTPVGMEQYDALKLPNETEEQFADRVVAEGQIRYKVKPDVQPAPARSVGTEKKEEDKKPKPNTYSKDTSPDYDQGLKNNKIQFDKTPGVYVVGKDGTQYNDFKPVGGFKIKSGGAIDVFGTATDQYDKVIQVVGGIDYDANKDQFTNLGYPDVLDVFRSIEDGTFSTPASSSSIPAANKASVQGINPN